jgi:hypothetical protein
MVNTIILCQKGLINRIKGELKRNTALEKGCKQKMAVMLLKEEKLKAEKS